MTDRQTQARADESTQKDPQDWVTGDERMTGRGEHGGGQAPKR